MIHRVDIGGELGIEAHWDVPRRGQWTAGIHTAHLLAGDQTPCGLLRLRPYHSQRSSVLPHAAYLLDSTVRGRTNNTRYNLFAGFSPLIRSFVDLKILGSVNSLANQLNEAIARVKYNKIKQNKINKIN